VNKKLLFILLALQVFIFGCKSAPHYVSVDTSKTDSAIADIQTKQTDITKGSTELSGTIDQIKTITDDAKGTGVISKPDTVKIIEYVDRSSGQVKKLTETIDSQTKQINDMAKSHIQDNANASSRLSEMQTKLDKITLSRDWYKSLAFKLAITSAILLLSIVGYIVLRVKKIIGI